MALPFASMLAFSGIMLVVLLIAFGFSYLFWSDRTKTPEVIAAEVAFASDRLSHISFSGLFVLGLMMLFIVMANFFPLPKF
jgi:hypothetical protein